MQEQTTINFLSPIRCGNLIIDIRCHIVTINNKKISLTYKEFITLCLLAQHPGWVFTKKEIYEVVYGDEASVNVDNIIFCLVYSLRRKIEPDPQSPIYIKTVHSVGYKFVKNN